MDGEWEEAAGTGIDPGRTHCRLGVIPIHTGSKNRNRLGLIKAAQSSPPTNASSSGPPTMGYNDGVMMFSNGLNITSMY